jgi:DNA-directed RNA polymerase specialized sigma24 family protein
VKEDGLKYREVAEILDISLKTVENQLAIALHKISKVLTVEHSSALPSTGSRHL